MDFELLTTLAIIHSLALMSPGPDFALTVKVATQQNRQVALAAALGISVGILILTSLSLTGVSLLIHSSTILFTLVQLMGASYLAWIGVHALKAAFSSLSLNNSSKKKAISIIVLSPLQAFRQGLLTNLLNPKALIFFITLFSTLITPEVDLKTQLASVILLFSLSLLWFSLLSLFLSKAHIQLRLKHMTPMINLVTGIIFLSIALGIIVEVLIPFMT
ncbi:LysE family translocator [Shewanella surugensis]|uniref:LysE family translocator n=1 Tax=Shewanella surugensis TaxID=212020 RepID=A0ABT0LC74_9GAMM|nr:LysE family translocator [Shewanella surugensis]MCL1125296.1 LysE family translocator [Shewanella surugensis]